jgi:hypothetical protein
MTWGSGSKSNSLSKEVSILSKGSEGNPQDIKTIFLNLSQALSRTNALIETDFQFIHR